MYSSYVPADFRGFLVPMARLTRCSACQAARAKRMLHLPRKAGAQRMVRIDGINSQDVDHAFAVWDAPVWRPGGPGRLVSRS